MTCERCSQPLDNRTKLVMTSKNHPVIKETGPLFWNLCENCASGVLLYVTVDETEVVETS